MSISQARIVLGVTSSATLKEVKTAYRKAAQKWHPDRNDSPESATEFSRASEAFDLLRGVVSAGAHGENASSSNAQSSDGGPEFTLEELGLFASEKLDAIMGACSKSMEFHLRGPPSTSWRSNGITAQIMGEEATLELCIDYHGYSAPDLELVRELISLREFVATTVDRWRNG